MKKKQYVALTISIVLLFFCTFQANTIIGGEKMKELKICWQRLVDKKGQTCDRCGTTEKAIEDAVQKLKQSLKGLDINVVLEKKTISSSTFSMDPLQSNRIWIDDKPIEKWLSATAGQSQCCSVCGDSECRTVTVDGKTYEAIPAELIIKAGLLAGAKLINSKTGSVCCPATEKPKKNLNKCPSSSKCKNN